MDRRHVAFRVVATLFIAAFVTIFAIRIVEPLGVDQGLFACFTRWVPRGWLPYRDLFDSKPPLFLYSYALASAIPGDVTRAIWILEGAWLAATLFTAYAIATRLWGRWAGLATATLLLVGLWSPSSGGFWSRMQAEELLAAPMMASAWLAYRARDRPVLAAWAGVLVGVCGLFKIPSMAIAVAWSAMWLATIARAEALRRIALLVAGMLAPWTIAVAWFGAHGAIGSFVLGVFVYQRHIAEYMSPPWSNVAQDFAYELVMRSSLPITAASIGVYLLAQRRAREAWLVAPWLVLTLAAIVAQRQLAGYHYLLAAPALAFAGGYAMREIARGIGDRATRGWSIGGAAVLALLALRAASSWWTAYAPDAAVLRGATSRADYLRSVQHGNYSNATEEEAARYVRDHSAPADGLLVWGLSPGIYALADRHPVTRFPFHKLLMTDAPLSRMVPGLDARRAELIDRLHADPPVYILVGRGDRNGFEPEESYSSMMRFRELREIIERDYARETEIGRFLVYRRAR